MLKRPYPRPDPIRPRVLCELSNVESIRT
jgi:hypothetical protein